MVEIYNWLSIAAIINYMRGRGKNNKGILTNRSRQILSPSQKQEARQELETQKHALAIIDNKALTEKKWPQIEQHFNDFNHWIQLNAYELGVDEGIYTSFKDFKSIWAKPQYAMDVIVIGRFLNETKDFPAVPEAISRAVSHCINQINTDYPISDTLRPLVDASLAGNGMKLTGRFLNGDATRTYKLAKTTQDKLYQQSRAFKPTDSSSYYSNLAEQQFAQLITSTLEHAFNFVTLEDATSTVASFAQANQIAKLVTSQGQLGLFTNQPAPTAAELSQASITGSKAVLPFLIKETKIVVEELIAKG